MNRSRFLHVLPIIAAAVTVGCGRQEDAARCDDAAHGQSVYLDVSYGADGMPDASPADCVVAPGTRVEWRGPAGVDTPFEIRFKAANPMPGAPGGRLGSSPGDGRQRAGAAAGSQPGRYPYAIRANSKERDPAIIIR